MDYKYKIIDWLTESLKIEISEIDKIQIVEYQHRDWSTVYRVNIGDNTYAVKIGGSAQYAEVETYNFLANEFLSCIPSLIGSKNNLGQYWLCLEWVDGYIFGDNPTLECMCQTAEKLAEIQNLSSRKTDQLKNYLPERSPATWMGIFEALLVYLRKHIDNAYRDYSRFAPENIMPLPLDLIDRLTEFYSILDNIILEFKNFPLSLEHGDMHARNFGLRLTGSPFIIDWANASVSTPFVSLEFMLRVTRNTLGGEFVEVVKRHYLDIIEFGDNNQDKKHNLEILCGLAPLNFADSILARERKENLPSGTLSWLVARSLNQMLVYYDKNK